jgi:dihydrofolate reductase
MTFLPGAGLTEGHGKLHQNVTGSIKLCHTLIAAGLVDEYRLFVDPIVQGRGRRLFPDGFELPLTLLQQKGFRGGVTLSRYAAGSAPS